MPQTGAVSIYDQIASNKRKTALFLFLFVLFIALLGYVYGMALDIGIGPLGIFGAVAIVFGLIGYFYSGNLLMAISSAREIKKEDNPVLFRTVENLSIGAGLPQPRIYIIEDSAPNAFAAGRDPRHSMVAVTTGLLSKLEKAELEGVIAHELSHIQNYDSRLMSIVAILAGSVALMSDIFLRWSWFGRGRRRTDERGGQIQLIIFIVAIVLAILAPFIAMIIKLAISRKREFLADASGAMLTRYPEGLARALEKISMDTEPLEAANKATAHMYIINPLAELKGSPRGWFSGLFLTHPPVEERVAALRSM